MPDVFADLPDHPDYLPLVSEVSEHLRIEPKLRIDRPVRIHGERKSRQAWSWFWRDADGLPMQCRVVIDINDPWHDEHWHGYTIKIMGVSGGFWITLESRNRAPISVDEVRQALNLAGILPRKLWSEAPDDADEFSW